MKKKKVKLFGRILTMFLFAVLLSGCSSKTNHTATDSSAVSSENTDKIQTIYVATQNNFPPFDYRDENDELVGYDIDLIKLIDEELPEYQFEFVDGDWGTIIPNLESGKCQLIADQMAYTEERAEKYYLSTPYYSLGLSLVKRKEDDSIQSIADLSGKTVELINGYSSNFIIEKWNEENGNPANIIYIDGSESDVRQDILLGRADATIGDTLIQEWCIQKDNLDLTTTDEVLAVTDRVLVYNKTEEGKEIRDNVDIAIHTLIANGKLEEASYQWLGANGVPQD